jgi:hypothetical protein
VCTSISPTDEVLITMKLRPWKQMDQESSQSALRHLAKEAFEKGFLEVAWQKEWHRCHCLKMGRRACCKTRHQTWCRASLAFYTNSVKAMVLCLQLDRAVLAHYRALLKQVRAHGLRVLLTLFHHSMPKWAIPYGGWTNQRTIPYFVEFSE